MKQIFDQKQSDPPVKLTPYQEKCLDQARQDIKEGRVYTNEEANKMMDEWLNK